ncbi:MAG: DUF2335 domain-containing protein [Planctomycetota bacterium]
MSEQGLIPPEDDSGIKRQSPTTIPEPDSSSSSNLTADQTSIFTAEVWRGALPRPADLRAFGELDPSFPERIVRSTELEQRHRHEVERQALSADRDDRIAARKEAARGQMFALVVCLSFLCGAIALALSGHPAVAAIAIGGTLVAIVTVFVTGRRTASELSHQPPDAS